VTAAIDSRGRPVDPIVVRLSLLALVLHSGVALGGCGPGFHPPTQIAHLDDSSFPLVVTTEGARGEPQGRFTICRERATRRDTPDYAFDLTAASRLHLEVVGASPRAQALVTDTGLHPIGCGGGDQTIDLQAGTYYVFLMGEAGRVPWELHLSRELTGIEAQEADDAAEIERRRASQTNVLHQMEDTIESAREAYHAREEPTVEGVLSATEPLVLRGRVAAGRCYEWFLVLPLEIDPRRVTADFAVGSEPVRHSDGYGSLFHSETTCVERAQPMTITIAPVPGATGSVVLHSVSWTQAAVAQWRRADEAAQAREQRERQAEVRRDPELARGLCHRCQDALEDCASIPRATRMTRDCESAFRRCLEEEGLTSSMCSMPYPGAR